MNILHLTFSALLAAGTLHAAVRTRTVEYTQGSALLEGYLAYDDSLEGRRPGVMVVHEWTGLGPYVKGRVEALAAMGYVAFGADIYGKGVRPASGPEAAKVAGLYKENRVGPDSRRCLQPRCRPPLLGRNVAFLRRDLRNPSTVMPP